MIHQKKTILFIFLAALLFQGLTMPALWCFVLVNARAEAADPSSYIPVSLPKKQFSSLHWLNENEFSIGNYRCDVKQCSQKNDRVDFLLKVDEKEKGLIENLKDHLKKNKEKSGVFSAGLYTFSPPFQCSLTPSKKETSGYIDPPSFGLNKTFLDKSSPPPKA